MNGIDHLLERLPVLALFEGMDVPRKGPSEGLRQTFRLIGRSIQVELNLLRVNFFLPFY